MDPITIFQIFVGSVVVGTCGLVSIAALMYIVITLKIIFKKPDIPMFINGSMLGPAFPPSQLDNDPDGTGVKPPSMSLKDAGGYIPQGYI